MLRLATLLLASMALLQPTPPTWRLVEEWRVGGEPSGPHSLHDVRQIRLLPNGRLAVLEFRDQQLHFLDRSGKPIRTVGRHGGGPGEYQNANGFVVFPNGNLLINDPDANRFTLLNGTGDFLRSIPVSHTRSFGGVWEAWVDQQGRLGEYVSFRRGETWISGRAIWSSDLTKADTLAAAACPPAPTAPSEARTYSFRGPRGGTMFPIPYATPRGGFLFTPEGGTWTSRWPSFASLIHLPAGACAPDVTIPLTGPAVAIPASVRDSTVNQVLEVASRYSPPGPDLERIPRTFPTFDVMRLDPNGQLWVSRWSDATRKRFEVYSGKGAPIATLEMPTALEPLRPMVITADRLYGIVTDADDVPYLVAYRIVK